MKATIAKRVSFDAAHFLPNYVGKCKNIHGHHWLVEVGVTGEVDSQTGMVMDFTYVKEVLDREVVKQFDHKLVNDTLKNPTAENIATYIRRKVNDYLGVDIEFVRVWETEDSYAEVRK